MFVKSFVAAMVLSLLFINLVLANSWVARYSGGGWEEAYAMTVDSSGNVYVTGTNNGDYITIKYDPNGNEVWESGYNGPSNGYDVARAIAVDGSGNVYITGQSYSDANGDDYLTIKYNSDGNQLWIARYDGPAHLTDYACAIALSPAGYIYVTGSSEGSGTGADYATIKYSSTGVQQWVSRYNNSAANDWDAACALAVDSAGNAYVTGSSTGSTTGIDFVTIRYRNSDGYQQNMHRWPSSGSTYENASALIIDDSNNVYITGISDNNYATIKYNSSLTAQWSGTVRRYNGDANLYDFPSAIAVDGSGNVYVTGQSYVNDTDSVFATIKYNSAGAQQWIAFYDGPAGGTNYPRDIAVDIAGNIYITGESYGGEAVKLDYVTIKYDSSGTYLWDARYNGPEHNDDRAVCLVIDNSGNAYVTGTSQGSGTGADFATIKNPDEVPYCAGPLVGDLNNDCVVDLGDFGEFAMHWLDSNLQ